MSDESAGHYEPRRLPAPPSSEPGAETDEPRRQPVPPASEPGAALPDLQTSYDRVARRYAEQFFDELSRKPFDRELLDRFAAAVAGRGPVVELGCGPGQIARYLRDRGVSISGLDLSPGMVAIAGELNPDIRFVQGTMLALDAGGERWAAAVAFYSLIHLSRAEAPLALREIWRALRAGGIFLLAFHGGEGEIHTEEWFGEQVSVDATLFAPDEMANLLHGAGFEPDELLERPPYDFEYPTRRVYIWAHKPL